MNCQFSNKKFSDALIDWYKKNKRVLPFRENQEPYRIWISEIMLQQTQMKTVIPYYTRFIKRFPTIKELASSCEEEVLKYWEGLGYYSRAKNIYKTAQDIVSKYHGVFPSDYKTILSLKGIGSYTAGAISSIAFNKPYPAVDGNVMRVLSRVLDIWDDIRLSKTKSIFESIVKELISKDDPSSFTQGLMELGALICTPKGQKCHLCPVNFCCKAYHEGYDDELPVKGEKTKQTKVKLVMVIIENDKNQFLVRKRSASGLLANFWEFIQFESKTFEEFQQNLFDHDGIEIKEESYLGEFKHVFTHRIWEIKAYLATLYDSSDLPHHFKLVTKDEIEKISFSTIHKKILHQFK
ncbi:A/G-specific adenine glycosylase [Mycoplasmatota bacterium]|nr:A/G-specific adenine glycosylase [Mycoplasmatota bacterium]